ncbi:MAG: histidine phosphatase family protein [Clostridia bacterium]
MCNTMEIIFVRHAQSVGNLEKKLCGSTDFPLSKQGEKQAKAIGKYLSNMQLDKIYSSPMLRAIDTAIYIQALQQNASCVYILDGVREMNFGLCDGMLHEKVLELMPEEFLRWQNVTRYPEGFPLQETADACIARFTDAVLGILEEEKDASKICIVTHGTALRLFLGEVLGYGKEHLIDIPKSKNTAISRLSYDRKTKKFTALELSNADHLEYID